MDFSQSSTSDGDLEDKIVEKLHRRPRLSAQQTPGQAQLRQHRPQPVPSGQIRQASACSCCISVPCPIGRRRGANANRADGDASEIRGCTPDSDHRSRFRHQAGERRHSRRLRAVDPQRRCPWLARESKSIGRNGQPVMAYDHRCRRSRTAGEVPETRSAVKRLRRWSWFRRTTTTRSFRSAPEAVSSISRVLTPAASRMPHPLSNSSRPISFPIAASIAPAKRRISD